MSMMTSQILKVFDFSKTQKSRQQNIFSSNKKYSSITHQGPLYRKKYFCSGGSLQHLTTMDAISNAYNTCNRSMSH